MTTWRGLVSLVALGTAGISGTGFAACSGSEFIDGSGVTVGRIQGKPGENAFFFEDGHAKRSYVITSDRVIVSANHREDWVCAWYQAQGGPAVIGWLQASRVVPDGQNSTEPTLPLSAWEGDWISGYGRISVKAGPKKGVLVVTGQTAHPSGITYHTDEIAEESGSPRRNRLVLQQGEPTEDSGLSKENCGLEMKLVPGLKDAIVVSDLRSSSCGNAMNVSFDGLYRRVGHLPAEVTSFLSRVQRCGELYGEDPRDPNQLKDLASAMEQARCAAILRDDVMLSGKYDADLVPGGLTRDAVLTFNEFELDLCEQGEEHVLSCYAGDGDEKLMSLCARPQLTSASSVLVFRMGREGALEVEYPSQRRPASDAFHFRLTTYGGDRGALEFETEKASYELEIGFDFNASLSITPRNGSEKTSLECQTGHDDTVRITPYRHLLRVMQMVVPEPRASDEEPQ